MKPIKKESDERSELFELKERKQRIEQSKQIPLLSNDLPIKGAYKHTFQNIELGVDESKYDWRTRTTNWSFKKEFSTKVFEEDDFEYPPESVKVYFSLFYIGFCKEPSFTVWIHPNTILGSVLNLVLKQPISNYFIACQYLLLDETYFDKTLNDIYERVGRYPFLVRIKDFYGRHYMKKYKIIPYDNLTQNYVLAQQGFTYKYYSVDEKDQELLQYRNPEDPPLLNNDLVLMKNVSSQT